ncbi:MAG: methyltransferase domain-containing protein [Nonomuraea sp.]|nr:methyltransferase domain-containing protein [Nonomuraea sp.]
MLLGPSYHPGGLQLTRRLLDRVELAPGRRLVDIAAGLGTTALLAAREHGVPVEGVDLSEANVALATGAAASAGLTEHVTFHHGDAEAVPLPDGCAAAVICECALCTFPDKATAMAEMARLLAPGGRLGLSDVAAQRIALPAELTGLSAWVACIADARPVQEYAALAEAAGLRVTDIEHHTRALSRMIDQIGARLELLKVTSRPRLEEFGVDVDRVGPVLDATRAAVADGALDYVLVIAEKPCA